MRCECHENGGEPNREKKRAKETERGRKTEGLAEYRHHKDMSYRQRYRENESDREREKESVRDRAR